jgi:hypothetical protein
VHFLHNDVFIDKYVCRFQGYVDAHRPLSAARGLSVAGGLVHIWRCSCAVMGPPVFLPGI